MAMALAPEWMSYTKESSPTQGSRFLGKERERGVPKYTRQLTFSHSSAYSPSNLDLADSTLPFACSVSSPPAPPHTPASILGDNNNPRVLNRSKSSPGFGSPKSKQKKSPERGFSNFTKPKPKPKPPLSPSSYIKSHSQPNLLNSEKVVNWQHSNNNSNNTNGKTLVSSSSSSSIPSTPLSPLATSSTSSSSSFSSNLPPSISPPPPSSSPPPVIIPEMDKLKTLIPTTAMPPKSVRPRVMVGPPPPISSTKKGNTQSTSSSSSNSSISNSGSSISPNSPSATRNGLASFFTKAKSEPSLMHHKDKQTAQDALNAARRAEMAAKKLRAIETEKAQGKLLREAVDSKQPKRKNFLQHVIKQEEQGSPLEDDSPIGIDSTSVTDSQSIPLSPPISSSSVNSSSSSISSPPMGMRSPLPEDQEDEERFLRTMGWVPDEEDPVPVLDEEEIKDVRVKIFLSKGAKSLDEREGEDVQNMGIGVDVK